MKYADVLRAQVVALEEERDALKAETDAIAALAEGETRSLNAEEDARIGVIIERGQAIKIDIAAKLERITALDDLDQERSNIPRGPQFIKPTEHPADPARLGDADARSAAVTFIERSKRFLKDDHRQHLTKLIESDGSVGGAAARMALTTGTEEYTRAWSKYMSGDSFALSESERSALAKGFDRYTPEERAGMTSGTGSSGGYFVPVFIDPTLIITGAGTSNPLRALSTVKTIGPAFGGWYGATAAQVTAAWTAEGAAAPDNTPTVTQPNIPVYMAEAFVQVSFQAFEDISDLAGDVQMLFADAKANLEGAAFVTGSGSSQPTGISTAVGAVTASRVAPATGGTIVLGDAFSVQNALPERFSSRDTSWVANIAVINKIRQLAMAQNSANSLWTDSVPGFPATYLGAGIYRAGSMSSSLTTGQDVLLYGDFSRYYIIDRIGFTTEFISNMFDPSTGRPVAQRGWFSHWRVGANTVDANAFRQLRL